MYYHDKEYPCQEEGCNSTDTIECRLTVYKNDLYKTSILYLLRNEGLKSVIEYLRHGYTDTHDYYCAEHCFKNGYCYGCGEFWAGSEMFDFSRNHLCSNCQGDPDLVGYEDDEPYYEMPDDYYDYDNQEYYPDEEYPEE